MTRTVPYSPHTLSVDVGPRCDACAESGTPEHWTVDPANGAVAVHVEPADREYRQLSTDADGYIRAPLLDATFRISRDGKKYRLLAR